MSNSTLVEVIKKNDQEELSFLFAGNLTLFVYERRKVHNNWIKM